MNEKEVLKTSVYVWLVGCLMMLVLGLVMQDISYLLGLIIGYAISVIAFLLIIKMSEGILKYAMSSLIVAGMFILKLILYALGFYIAVQSPYVHLVTVFIGYMMIKMTIYLEGYIHKGGE